MTLALLWADKVNLSEHLQSEACQAGEEGFRQKLVEERNLNSFHSYQFDPRASKTCPEFGERPEVRRRTREEQHEGIPAAQAGKLASSFTKNPF